MTILPREIWQSLRTAHQTRVGPWVAAHRERATRGMKHPVYDFLFTYYSFRSGHLLRWSPGLGVTLEAYRRDLDWSDDYRETSDGVSLDTARFPAHRQSYLQWAIDYHEAILVREPSFHCFGLHEWAMVYRTAEVRHANPLRLSAEDIAAVVEEQGLRCTHYDAYRFFTPAAAPRNRIELTRADTIRQDQGGCIHAAMDLYKFAYAIVPFIPSLLLAECFELAIAAREIDMRASPYDLRTLGFAPIPIETRDGRELYVHEQRNLADRARPLRTRMLEAYRTLLERTTIAVTAP